MTNTHITVGGHKVTTNKVGTVHNVTAQSGLSGADPGYWIVINGVCYIDLLVSPPTAGTYNITGFPKAKITATGVCTKNRNTPAFGNAEIYANTTTIILDIQDYSGRCSLVYPVADDWVES